MGVREDTEEMGKGEVGTGKNVRGKRRQGTGNV